MESAKIDVRDLALRIARGYVGQQETPAKSNWGPFVRDTLKTVGINFPAAWCCAFTYRVFKEACEALGQPIFLPKTGGVLKCWQTVSADRKIARKDVAKNVIEPGYLGVMRHGDTTGHIFIVTSYDNGVIKTIEGNTDIAGGRTGGKVCELTRNISDPKIIGFIKTN